METRTLPGSAAQASAVHRLCKLDEVGVDHLSTGVAFFVEQVLPLANHALEIVVQKQNLHPDIEFSASSHFSLRHHEAAITIDVDHHLVLPSKLGA
jgi:hypothetical protein